MKIFRKLARGGFPALLALLLAAQVAFAAGALSARSSLETVQLCSASGPIIVAVEASGGGAQGGEERPGPHCPYCVIGAAGLPSDAPALIEPLRGRYVAIASLRDDSFRSGVSFLARDSRAPPSAV